MTVLLHFVSDPLSSFKPYLINAWLINNPVIWIKPGVPNGGIQSNHDQTCYGQMIDE